MNTRLRQPMEYPADHDLFPTTRASGAEKSHIESGNQNPNVRDIAERKLAEQQLQATRKYLRTVFDNVYDAIFVHDLTGKVVDVNEKLLEIYNISRDEALNLSIIEDYSAEDNPIDQLPRIWGNVLAGQNQFFEWKAKRPKDGSIFDVEVFLTRLSLPDGDLILANVRDITERKLAEQQLQATRKYLRTVFDNVYDAIFVHDLTGKVIDVNEKMLKMYGVTREEALSRFIVDDYSAPGNDIDELYGRWKKAMSDERQFFEWRAKRPKDGSMFNVEVFLTRVSLPQGDFMLANVRDITERKIMEMLLARERETLLSVMKNNPYGIALLDNRSRFVYLNPEFTNITGYTLQDLPSLWEWLRKAFPESAYRDRAIALWKADRVTEGRGRDMEWKITCKNGQHKDIEFRITYLDDKSLIMLTDTTARRRMEEQLRAEKQKFQSMSDSSPLGILMLGSGGSAKYINPKFKEIFGYDLDEVPSARELYLRAYPNPFYRNPILSSWLTNLKLSNGREGRPRARKVTCKDGTQKYVNFTPVHLETRETLLTCEDISESVEAEEKLKQRNLELEILNEIIGSVSSSLHLPEILETLQRVFLEKLKIPVGGIFLYSNANSRLSLELSWGVWDDAISRFGEFALKEHSAGTAMHEDAVAVIRHYPVQAESCGFVCSGLLGTPLASLNVPLLAKGGIQGTIFLLNKEHSFRQEQVPFFVTLGQQVGMIIENARLFSQVRQSNTQMRALSLEMVKVQEAERRSIARELHDQIGQELTGLKFALEMNMLHSEGKARESAVEAKSMVNKLVVLVRELSLKLRPSMLDDLGLLPTLLWHFERFTSQTAISVSFKHSGCNDKRFPREVETGIYRITQEALTNVARHAHTDQVVVRLWADRKAIGVQIEDHGVGFDDSLMDAGKTGGLNGMRERARLLGGRFTIDARPAVGTRVTAEFPMEPDGNNYGQN